MKCVDFVQNREEKKKPAPESDDYEEASANP